MSSKKTPANKPKTERRRRARINQSLEKMKFLIPEARRLAVNKQGRIEKAEILEIAVNFIEESLKGFTPQDGAPTMYRAGFARCVSEIQKYAIEKHQDMDDLLTFLFKRMGDPTELHYEKLLLLPAGNGHMSPAHTVISPQTPNLSHRHPMNRRVTYHCSGSPVCRPVPVVHGLTSTQTSVSKLMSPEFYMDYSPVNYSSVQPQASQCTHTIHHKDIVYGQAPGCCQIKSDLISL